MRANDLHEVLVSGVRQINVATFFVGEGHEEAMREALRLSFGADVGAPLKIADRVDLARQCSESRLDFFDLILRRPLFEFEEHNVPQHFLRRLFGLRSLFGLR